jgi:hypothetical protein
MYFLHIYEYGTLEPIKAILRRGKEKSENIAEDEPNLGTLYTYMEMSH